MTIGATAPAEWKECRDPETGRLFRQLTAGRHNNYPLYYFVPSITPDSRYLVFHSERTGWVQLHRLDLETGEIVQLTHGRTRNSGWAIWCEPHLRGIYNHLSALNETRGEVYYFQDEELRCTHLSSLKNWRILQLPGRISIGQTGFSPDGCHFAFIHADRRLFEEKIADRQALTHMGQFNWGRDHNPWRDQVPTTLSLVDTATGSLAHAVELDYHVHHVFFIDNRRLLINHVRDDSGMWTLDLNDGSQRILRPRDAHGVPCHQVITARGIYYEANQWDEGRRTVYIGRYNLDTDTFAEVELPGAGYIHTGRDPAGRFLFYEDMADTHRLISVHYPHDPSRFEIRLLRTLPPIPFGQRYHAHPFLSPDRRWLIYTELVDGFSQVCALDVADLVDLADRVETHV